MFLLSIFCFGSYLMGQSIAEKDALNDNFPKQFTFRGEYKTIPNSTYKNFVRSAIFSEGFIQKYVPYDELPRVDPQITGKFASRYVNDYPNKMVLLHWDAEEHVNNIKGSSDRFFPGHWSTFVGTCLSADISAKDKVIPVDDLKYLNNPAKNPKALHRSKWVHPGLLIVEIDDRGKPLWEHYEYVELQEVDREKNAVIVKRGQSLSTSRNFGKGSRIVPIQTYISTPVLYGINYSTSCPKDKNGKTATDILFEELVDIFDKEKGLLPDLNGIAFDVLNWAPPHYRNLLDADGDGVADGAYDPVTGEDLWRKGAYEFQKRLREHFGPDFIMTGDSYCLGDQRAMGVFNGIESEGLVKHNDAFRGFSKTVNIFSYWQRFNPLQYKIGNIVPKVMNPVDKRNEKQYVRLCTVTATCLDAAINTSPVVNEDEVSDEIRGGDLDRIHWLGRPLGTFRDLSLEGKDLLNGAGSDVNSDWVRAWKPINCSLKVSGHKLCGMRIKEEKGAATIDLGEIVIPNNVDDVTFSLQLRSLTNLDSMDSLIPRYAKLYVEGLPQYEDNIANNCLYNDIYGLFGKEDYSVLTFYYRNVAGRKLRLQLTVEGSGEFLLCNFKAHAAPQVLVREYEYGVALVNPSLHDYTFNLFELFGENIELKKLKGKELINDGKVVRDRLTLGALEGIFLQKVEKSQNDD